MKLAMLTVAVAVSQSLSSMTLSVRVVDETWVPLPGIEVELLEVKSCATREPGAAPSIRATSVAGAVEFSVAPERSYVVRAGGEGALERRWVCLRPGASSPTAYVQLRLRSVEEVVLLHPALKDKSKPSDVPLGSLAGQYRAEGGELYQVSVLEDGKGLEVSLPEGLNLYFPRREGLNFSGPGGTVSFELRDGAVAGLVFTPRVVRAERPK
jgi:hypothetical protein